MSRTGSTSEVEAGDGILVELRNVIQVSQESRADAMHAETSLAAVLASVPASKDSCAHVTADQEVSEKTLAEKLKTSATVATDSLTPSKASLRYLDPGQVNPAKLEEMKQSFCPCVTFLVAEVGCISQCPQCVASVVECAQLASRISGVMQFGAGAGVESLVKVKQVIADLMEQVAVAGFARGRPRALSRR